jgi:delta24-sterol reductase
MIIPAKKYLKMEYIPVKTKAELLKRFAIESNKGKENMFVEGLMYSENTAVIMLGNMTDHAESGKVLGYSFEYLYLRDQESKCSI